MAEASWPDPADGRVVDERQYELLSARHCDDGLYWQPGDPAPVYADGAGGLVVHVRANLFGCVRGFGWTSGDSETDLAIGANNSGSTRTDRVVLRLDRSDWTVRLAVKQGVTSPGDLTRDAGGTGVWETHVAWVTVPNAASSILANQVVSRPTAVGSRIRPQHSADRDPKPHLGQVAYDSDTGRWVGWNGLQWVTIWQDLTAQATLSPTTNWRAAGPCWVRRTQYGLVQINLNLIRQNVAWTGADPQGSPLTRVPAAYRPQGYIAYGHTHVTPNNQARFRVEEDGWVYGDNPTNRVDPGRALRFTFVYVP